MNCRTHSIYNVPSHKRIKVQCCGTMLWVASLVDGAIEREQGVLQL